ncbi:AraC family transcriptional regulator [Chelonobacter oris]|uniref:AraC family transcriptional regulator n=1 Tax=Chelonobacter oris TaxID=505317 RepID=UPI00068BC2F1|nr:AraC family transcriptional regulator [Chelonobacter oris]
MDTLFKLAARHAVDIMPGTTDYPPHRLLADVTPYRFSAPTKPETCIETPFCALVLQGEKNVLADNRRMQLRAGHINLAAANMPITSSIVTASAEQPYLGVIFRLDLDEISHLISEHHLQPPSIGEQSHVALADTTPELSDAFRRLLALLDRPDACPILAPLIRREIHYWLLQLPVAAILFQAALSGSQSYRIRRATEWLRHNFSRPLSVQALAEYVQMSLSSFHAHFRSVTGITPLQFQKQLRLQEARRLMLSGECDAGGAAFSVGYESASQFSREYRRHFGAPPAQDIHRLQATAS